MPIAALRESNLYIILLGSKATDAAADAAAAAAAANFAAANVAALTHLLASCTCTSVEVRVYRQRNGRL